MTLVPVAGDEGSVPAVRDREVAELRQALARVARSRAVPLLCFAILLAQLVGRGWILARHSFFADDFEMQLRAHYSGLGAHYLTARYDERYQPGVWLLVWIVARSALLNWTAAAASVLGLQAVAGLAVIRMLMVVFGRRPAVPALFLLYAITPLGLSAATWWSAALASLPVQAATAMAVAAHVEGLRGVRGRRLPRRAVATVGWLVVGLLFDIRALVILPLLFVLTAVYFTSGRPLDRIRSCLRVHRGLWAAGVVVAIAYAILASTAGRLTPAGAPAPPTGTFARFAAKLVGESFVPAAFGGPWSWQPLGSGDGLAATPTTVRVLVGAVAIAVVVLTIWYRRHAAWAWTLLLGWLLFADVLPTALQAVGASGSYLGLLPRYAGDAAVVFVLCVGLAFLALPGELNPYRRPLPAPTVVSGLVGGSVVALTCSALITSQAWVSSLPSAAPTRDYLANAEAALSNSSGDIEIADTYVPNGILSGDYFWYSPYRETAQFMGALEPRLRGRFNDRLVGALSHPAIFDDAGHLVPAAIQGVGTTLTDKTCPIRVKYGQRTTLTLPPELSGSYGMVTFTPDADDPILGVSYGGPQALVHLPSRTTAGSGRATLYFPLSSHGDTVELTLASGTSPGDGACLTDLEFGGLVPAATALMTRG